LQLRLLRRLHKNGVIIMEFINKITEGFKRGYQGQREKQAEKAIEKKLRGALDSGGISGLIKLLAEDAKESEAKQ